MLKAFGVCRLLILYCEYLVYRNIIYLLIIFIMNQITQWFSALVQRISAIKQQKPQKQLWPLISKSKKEIQEYHTPSISWLTSGQMTLFWVIGVIVIYFWYLAFQSLHLLYLIFAAWIISIALESFIVTGQRWMPRGVSIALSYVLLLVFILTGMVIIVPFILQQLSAIIATVIQYFYAMQSQISILWLNGYIQSLSWLPSFIKGYLLDWLSSWGSQEIQSAIVSNLSNLVSTGTDYAKQIASTWVSIIGSIFSFLGQVGLVLTVAVFFSLEKDTVVNTLTHRLSQQSKIQYRTNKIDLLYIKMWLWLKSQLWLCVYIALIVYVVLRILALFGIDLPNKSALALMAGFTEFIPYIWPLLWGIPALVLATSMYGLPGMLAVGIAYYLIQWTENNVLIPMLMQKSLGVSPLLIFLCVLLWWSVLWFIGVMLAVPFAVIMTLLFDKDFE